MVFVATLFFFVLLRHHYVIITSSFRFDYLSRYKYHYVIITSSLRHYYVIITLLLRHHYYVITITSFANTNFEYLGELDIGSWPRIMLMLVASEIVPFSDPVVSESKVTVTVTTNPPMIGKTISIVSITRMISKITSVSTISSFLYRRDFSFILRFRIYFTISDPRPDHGLRPAFFNVFAAPPTSATQRRCQFGWQNQWKLCWRRLVRRGRYNSAQQRYMEDDYLDCPVDVEYYRDAPAVWCDMPTGTFLFYVAT